MVRRVSGPGEKNRSKELHTRREETLTLCKGDEPPGRYRETARSLTMKIHAATKAEALSCVLTTAFLLLVGTSSMGCAQELQLGEFAPSVEKFEAEAALQGAPVHVSDLIIERGPLEHGIGAVCHEQPGATPRIVVNEADWDQFSASYQESILFHELGHCVLGRAHVPAVEGRPPSLMVPAAPEADVYEQNRAFYLNELFHPASE
jgi:hypothetical protein